MIYLDYNSTTPVDERVLAEMLPFFSEHFGNASSNTHAFGWFAQGAIEKARTQVADFIGAETSEIVFTSGATEAINMALKGIFEAYQSKGNHIITCVTEHKAVLDTCAFLEENGATITYLGVDREGRIDLDELKNSFTDKTILVAIMAANNETGVLQDLEKISEITHSNNVILFSDTTQMAGKLPIDVNEMGIDVCCISAHKLYGPKGAGAMYVRRKNPRVSLIPLFHGGGHENNKRSGTLNVPGIIGLGKACGIAKAEFWDNNMHISKVRGFLEHQLLEISGLRINGSTRYRLYNTSNLYFPLLNDGSTVFSHLKHNYAVSLGSACTSANAEPSHVLKAMGMEKQESENSIRFSFGNKSQKEEIEKLAEFILSLYK
ncbi:MAG: aminotransferase class V-fold PLP-dependent enzyme [Bacteroidetes bacterium]|jgi:cysteine desulfurase|nr:aminotransferase class V-fold PLP-dependent enzyme [Bacteroidota bacterium]MDF2451151.1 aminotransferase class V-fold PLP-dependent enzyme [Bacteroidota bacterium]